ncbi:MAG: outer membrane protein OmpA-like peptidoglycan-associated protein [Neolewinella sp.]|jgi:OOP family OmpA-OmpF porin
MFKHLLLAFAMLACTSLFGQSTQFPWEFGLQLGTSSIGGDLIENDIVFLNQPRLGAGVTLRRRLGNSFALRGHLMYGSLESDDAKSDDAEQAARGFTSKTTVIEPGLIFEFEPFAGKRFEGGQFKKSISPYIGLGVAYGIWGDVENTFNGQSDANITADNAADTDESGGLVFPIVGGLKYYISPKSSIGLDVSWRITSSDLIDGVAQAGNPSNDDTYVFTGLTFSTGFGKPDTDKDGIYDEDDACPTEAGPISTMGCPDTDSDGVADKDDKCPQVAGLANLAGCPDGDGDGVADGDDDCPTEAGLAALNGCPDGDGDGIADKDDKCPTEAGLASLMGCPDADGDGIADGDDACPAEAGPARTNGCPDGDGDGIIDKEDECPTVAGVASLNGCPEPTFRAETLPERIVRYNDLLDEDNDGMSDFEHITVDSLTGTISIDRIYFPTNISRLNRPDRVIIEEVDRFLALPGADQFSIRFEGHADRRSSDEYNQGLSERRAGSAETYSIDKGAATSKLSQIGFGENQPVGETLRENRVVIPVSSEPTRMIKTN